MELSASPIEREELQARLRALAQGEARSEDVRAWVARAYFPLHAEIGTGESESVRESMHAILNWLEHHGPGDIEPRDAERASQLLDAASEFTRMLASFRSEGP